MSNFEKKFGKYAIKNISLVLISCYAIGYVLQLMLPNIIPYLTLNPYEILFHGQIWRLVTWIVILPSGIGIFPLMIMMLLYYSLGNSLERVWGTYRYNVYLLSGILFTIVGSFIGMGIVYLFYGNILTIPGNAEAIFSQASAVFSTYYINMSIFLAYAITFPDAQLLLMFIFPIRVKWLGIIYGAMLVLNFFMVGNDPVSVFYRMAILASLVTVLFFWLTTKNRVVLNPKVVKMRHHFKQDVRKHNPTSDHKCTICGRTNKDDETLEFRFCSKCNGNHEYCQNHLFTHEHIK